MKKEPKQLLPRVLEVPVERSKELGLPLGCSPPCLRKETTAVPLSALCVERYVWVSSACLFFLFQALKEKGWSNGRLTGRLLPQEQDGFCIDCEKPGLVAWACFRLDFSFLVSFWLQGDSCLKVCFHTHSPKPCFIVAGGSVCSCSADAVVCCRI